jgi:hypothetical protein
LFWSALQIRIKTEFLSTYFKTIILGCSVN